MPTSLAAALIPNSSFLPLVQPGLSAMLPADRGLILPAIRQSFGDGIDLDSATQAQFPNENRWDYILSVPAGEKLIGIEPHTASDSEIKVIVKKKANAQRVLRDHLRPHAAVAEWHWITHGAVRFSIMSRAVRALSQNGIRFGGRVLRAV